MKTGCIFVDSVDLTELHLSLVVIYIQFLPIDQSSHLFAWKAHLLFCVVKVAQWPNSVPINSFLLDPMGDLPLRGESTLVLEPNF